MSKPISQREARRLRKRVRELEQQREAERRKYGSDYPGECLLGLDEGDLVRSDTIAVVRTAQMLRHPVIVRMNGDRLVFYGAK